MRTAPYSLSILSDAKSWINAYLPTFILSLKSLGHTVTWVHRPQELPEGEIAFFLGCYSLVKAEDLAKHKHNLVVHASDLPKGRGWAPLAWQILEGKNEIPIVMFEAQTGMDTGNIYLKDTLTFEGHELSDEIRQAQAMKTLSMCHTFLNGYPSILASQQTQEGEPTFYPRRTAESSKLDIHQTIASQFQLLRIVDNQEYPAFFEYQGHRYTLTIRKNDT
ncbi:MAG: methionyl-tRNA formyltransferase [Vampirovibrionales bacterium]